MKKTVVWNISSNKPFPLDMWKHPKIGIELKNLGLDESKNLVVSEDEFNLLFLQVTLKEWNSIQEKLIKNFCLHPFISIIIVSCVDFPETVYKEVASMCKFLVLENPLHLRELRIILDRIIQAEFFKSSAMEIGNGCLSNIGFFEGVFDLAHKEYEDKQKENLALKSILEYEGQVKRIQNDINKAMQTVNELRNHELIELHERIRANEQLDVLRQTELKNALESKKATEKALEYSRIEEIHMDRIIKAQDRLFAYTETEILALLEENRSLKIELESTKIN